MESLPFESSNAPNRKAAGTVEIPAAKRTPFEFLCEAAEEINPAIILADELMRKGRHQLLDPEDIERAREALESGQAELRLVERHLADLTKLKAVPAAISPTGF